MTRATESPATSPAARRARAARQMLASSSANVRSPVGEVTATSSGIARAHSDSEVAVAAAAARSSAVGNGATVTR